MRNRELELYLHIPFCHKKCGYCDFLSAPGKEETKKKYIETLLKEILQKEQEFKEYMVTSIFFGGGTPTIMDPQDIKRVVDTIRETFLVLDLAEITIEANPGTLNSEKLITYRACGINRLSLGLQSTYNKELVLLGRIHTYEEFEESYALARECGFSNINIDLMSALPEQTLGTWSHTLERIIKLEPEHISAYGLIIEEGTPFYEAYQEDCKRRDKGEIPFVLPSEETERRMYYLTQELLKTAGYPRYEISNYAKVGRECQHNIGYWRGKEYLGLGLGAASYINGKRFSNTSDLQVYCEENFQPENESILSIKEQMEEFMFLGLRMIQGISKKDFHQKFHTTIEEIYGQVLVSLEKEKLIFTEKDVVELTDKGIDVSNYVLAHFLFQ